MVADILGHVSLRVSEARLLVRARGPTDQGLLLSTADDVVLVDLDGAAAEDLRDHALPQELPIHLAVLRRHPDMTAVVHAHPPDVVACSIGALPDLGSALNDEAVWRAHLARLAHLGLDVPG